MRKFRIKYMMYTNDPYDYCYVYESTEEACAMECAIGRLIEKQKKNGVNIDIIKAEMI